MAPNIDTATIGQHLPPGWGVGADFREHFAREYPEHMLPRQSQYQPGAGGQEQRQAVGYMQTNVVPPMQQVGADAT